MELRSLGIMITATLLIAIAGCRLPSSPTPDQPEALPTASVSRRITVATLAGSGKTGPLGGGYKDGPASDAEFHDPMGLAFDGQGNLYVSDWVNQRIRVITSDGRVRTFAGAGQPGPEGDLDDGPADVARFFGPEGLAVDAQGNLFVADTLNNRIRRISPDGMVSSVAGSGPGTAHGFDGALADGLAEAARFNDPSDVAVDGAGTLYVTDRLNHVIRKITPDGQVSTFAGTGEPGSLDGAGRAASFELPNRIAIDRQGNLYITEGRFLDFGERTYGFRVRKLTPDAQVTTLAGTGEPGYRDGPGSSAQFDVPIGVAVDAEGNVYIVDSGAHRIRQISRDGMVSTIAGSGAAGYADGPAAEAEFWYPADIAVGPDGRLYVADWKNHRIRIITIE